MPIRFTCTCCRQPLSIGKRKAGTQVTCPKCQSGLTVPMLDKPVAAIPPPTSRHFSSAKLFPFDDLTTVIETPTPERFEPATSVVIDRSLIAISRRVLYVQAALITFVAIAAFAIGYLSGRGQPQTTVESLQADDEPVSIGDKVVRRDDATSN
jgi:hypothetical protein